MPLLLDSITDLRPAHRGEVALSGSHGGVYPATLASRGGLRAVIFNDAGIGYERAGVGGVMALDDVGMAAAALDCMSCRIGDAEDSLASGVVSVVNKTASKLGIAVGDDARDALEVLEASSAPRAEASAVGEGGQVIESRGARVHLLDSASMVGPEHVGSIVITGSHGGLIGGDPSRALKSAARLAVFSDAGVGKDQVALGRLGALDERGIAAATASHESCRIGDAVSVFETGVLSHVNVAASRMGACSGMSVRALINLIS